MTVLPSPLRRVVVALLILLACRVGAEARTYPVEAIQPGLRGTAKTVIRGTEIESFEVEFLGVMRDAGPVGDLILIRASGDVIERSGGIAAGMSGSPVYIDERLVGAISYGYSLSDHRIGFVTPISDMLDVLNMVNGSETDGPSDQPSAVPWVRHGYENPDHDVKTPVVEGSPVREAILASTLDEAQVLANRVPSDTLVFAPVRAPLLAAGLSKRAFARLGEQLATFDIVPVQIGGAPPADVGREVPLQPGSAFGVQLARGDVSLTSIGTVTYVDGDRFIGFGHSFLDRGSVDYVTSSAYIHHVVQSITNPFKLGSAIAPVGTLAQDRGAGVAGRIGQTPKMIPITVSVHDRDRDVSRTSNFEIVADDGLIVELATTGALALLDRGIDRLGRGTARVVFQIEADGMPRPLVRDNLYYSDRDISALSLLEFIEAISLVVNNRFSPVDVTRIQLTAQIEQKRWTAHLENAVPDKFEVHPGDTVNIEVQLRPYRSEPRKEVLALTVPHDALPGYVTVEVRGGGWGLRPPAPDEETIIDDPEEFLGMVSDLERLVDEFVRRERNNEIVAEFYGRRDDRFDDEDGKAHVRANRPGMPAVRADGADQDVSVSPGSSWYERHATGGWVVATRPTSYVVLGSHFFDLHITTPSDTGDSAREHGHGSRPPVQE